MASVLVTGTSKGRGHASIIKRHNFHGGPESHGSMFHRAPGSIGASSFPSRVFPGMKMAGHMGAAQVTVRNLEIVQINADKIPSGPAYALARTERELFIGSGRSGRYELNPERVTLAASWTMAEAGPALAPPQMAGAPRSATAGRSMPPRGRSSCSFSCSRMSSGGSAS